MISAARKLSYTPNERQNVVHLTFSERVIRAASKRDLDNRIAYLLEAVKQGEQYDLPVEEINAIRRQYLRAIDARYGHLDTNLERN